MITYKINEGDMFMLSGDRYVGDRYLVTVKRCFYQGGARWECFFLHTKEMLTLDEHFIMTTWTKVV